LEYRQAQPGRRKWINRPSNRQRLFGESSEEVAASYNDMGLVYSSTDVDKALAYYEKAFAVYQKIHGKEHRKIAIASNNIGTM